MAPLSPDCAWARIASIFCNAVVMTLNFTPASLAAFWSLWTSSVLNPNWSDRSLISSTLSRTLWTNAAIRSMTAPAAKAPAIRLVSSAPNDATTRWAAVASALSLIVRSAIYSPYALRELVRLPDKLRLVFVGDPVVNSNAAFAFHEGHVIPHSLKVRRRIHGARVVV